MPVTVSQFDHNAQRFAAGYNAASGTLDTFKVALYTSATFVASATTLALVTPKVEVTAGNGYTAGGATLGTPTITQVNTNDAKFDAQDVSWTVPAGGTLSAAYAILYSTDTNSPPLLFIDFGGTQTVTDGGIFQIIWDANGIFTFTVA
jgi:hypothetical protein